MISRLCVLAFVLATPTAFAPAQVGQVGPLTAPAGNLVVTAASVFVLQDGVLYKFDVRTLELEGLVRLGDLRRGQISEEITEEVDVAEPEEVEQSGFDGKVGREWNATIGLGGGKAGGKYRYGTSEAAVDNALRWLVDRQDEDGKWDADAFMKHDTVGKPCDGAGNPTHDVGVTALTTLAFLSSGSTMRAGPHRETIKQAVKWLRDQQNDNGLIGTNASHDFIYGHSIAAFALSEAYGLSNYKLLRNNVQRAINYLESHRNPYSVWRYQPRDNDNDTSVTTWAWLACRSARDFGIDVNPNTAKMVESWYDQVTDDNGRTGYSKRGEVSSRMSGDHATRFPPENGEALTAAALFGRFMLGQTPKSEPSMKKSAQLLLARQPKWEKGSIDPYYWWFGTQAMYQVGGRSWQEWNKGLDDLIRAQRTDGNAAGSWDPVGVWDCDGGRVYATALYVMTLQVRSRMARLQR